MYSTVPSSQRGFHQRARRSQALSVGARHDLATQVRAGRGRVLARQASKKLQMWTRRHPPLQQRRADALPVQQKKHGKYTPGRRVSRPTSLTAKRYGVTNVKTSSKRAGDMRTSRKATHSQCSSVQSVRRRHGSEGQLCCSDRTSLRGRPTQLPQGAQSHHPPPLLTCQMQTKTPAQSSQVHPSGSPHKTPCPAAVSRSVPTRHRSTRQPHPRIVEQRPPVWLVPGRLPGGPAQAATRRACMTSGGSTAMMRGTKSTRSNVVRGRVRPTAAVKVRQRVQKKAKRGSSGGRKCGRRLVVRTEREFPVESPRGPPRIPFPCGPRTLHRQVGDWLA